MMSDISQLSRAALVHLETAEAREIERDELDQLGHRLVFNKQTGACRNLSGIQPVDVRLLDANGYLVRRTPA